MLAGHEINGHNLNRNIKQRAQEAHLVAIAGQFEVVEPWHIFPPVRFPPQS
jgi:hypothetical protein